MPYHLVAEDYLLQLNLLLEQEKCTEAMELVRQLISVPGISEENEEPQPAGHYILYIAAMMSQYMKGAGGFAHLLISPEGTLYEEQNSKNSTYQYQMELEALAAALRNVPEGAAVRLYTESENIVNMFAQRWIQKWAQEKWKKGSSYRPNLSLLKEIYRYSSGVTAELPAETDELARICREKAQSAIQRTRKQSKHSLSPIPREFRG